MDMLHFWDWGYSVSFGCERSCSSAGKLSNFYKKVLGGIYVQIKPEKHQSNFKVKSVNVVVVYMRMRHYLYSHICIYLPCIV